MDLVNDTDERHTFHIHRTDLVLSVGGYRLETIGVRADVDLLVRAEAKAQAKWKIKIHRSAMRRKISPPHPRASTEA